MSSLLCKNQYSSNMQQLVISSGAALDCATAGDESAAASYDWRVAQSASEKMDIPKIDKSGWLTQQIWGIYSRFGVFTGSPFVSWYIYIYI